MTLAYKSGQTVFRRRLNSIPTFAFNLDQASNKKKKNWSKFQSGSTFFHHLLGFFQILFVFY